MDVFKVYCNGSWVIYHYCHFEFVRIYKIPCGCILSAGEIISAGIVCIKPE